MGMFDYIQCKYPLPDVDLSGTTLNQKDLAADCQTKDLENILRCYTIEEDGRISYIQYKNSKWIEGDPKAKNPMDRFGYMDQTDPETCYLSGNHVIEFGNFLTDNRGDFDYSWDWEATVLDGKVQTIRLVKLEKLCNKQRKQTDLAWEAQTKKTKEFQKTFYYKYFYKYIIKYKHWLRYKIITWLQKLITLLYKI